MYANINLNKMTPSHFLCYFYVALVRGRIQVTALKVFCNTKDYVLHKLSKQVNFTTKMTLESENSSEAMQRYSSIEFSVLLGQIKNKSGFRLYLKGLLQEEVKDNCNRETPLIVRSVSVQRLGRK